MKMKRCFVCCIIFLFVLAGCAAPVPADQTQSKAAPSGDKIETEKFSISIPKGWTSFEIPGGFQIYKGSDLLEISFSGKNMTDDDDKAAMDSLIKQYNGQPVENETMLGLQFRKTTFTANGIEQSIYTCIRSGEQVKIQIGGNLKNKEIMDMLQTVQFK